MQLFVGLTFSENHLHYQKIDSFRRRFDQKYSRSPLLQMTLLAPFFLELQGKGHLDVLVDHLEEELSTHLHGFDEGLQIPFEGFDFKTGRGAVLYLRPKLPDDLFHCQEVMHEVIEENGGVLKKKRILTSGLYNDTQTFLPIGRFVDSNELITSIAQAKVEFSKNFSLGALHITLFEKIPGQWIPRKNLFTFKEERPHRFKENVEFLI